MQSELWILAVACYSKLIFCAESSLSSTFLIPVLLGGELLQGVLFGPVQEELPLLDDAGGVCLGVGGESDGGAAVGVEGPGAVGRLAPVVHGEEGPVGEAVARLVPGWS